MIDVYHATTYVLLLTRRVAYHPTCRACKSNGLWSNNSALCAPTRHQAKANTRFTARLHFRKLRFHPLHFRFLSPSLRIERENNPQHLSKIVFPMFINEAKYLLIKSKI